MGNRNKIVLLAHILPSMVSVIKSTVDAGLDATIIGKPYSTIPRAAEAMRDLGATVHCPDFGAIGQLLPEMRAFVRGLNLSPQARFFDSGGVLKSIYGSGNQLTSHQATRPDDVGLDPVKRSTEAPHIARAILSQIPYNGKRIMVVGGGVIGQALKKSLAETGAEITENYPQVIIGATGSDLSQQLLPFLRESPELYSASSWDIEFNRLLKCDDSKISISNRGCPVNFTRQEELEPADGMQATRAALLKAILNVAEPT